MPSALDIASLTAQVEALRLSDGHRWKLAMTPGTLKVHAELSPAASSDVYCLRLDFGDSLAAGPASVAFCAVGTHEEGRLKDWPRGLTDYFKAPPNGTIGWICNPWTREGRAHHPEWASIKWRPSRAVWTTLTAIQDILDKPGAYTGRAA